MPTSTPSRSTASSPEHNREDALQRISEKLSSHSARWDREGSFPHEGFDLLAKSEVLRLPIPAHQGGESANLEQQRQVIAAIAKGDPSVALVLAMHYLFLRSLTPASSWPEKTRQEIYQSVLRYGAIGNALNVEPDLGTPSRGGLPATVASRVGDHWVLNGRKIYATGAPRLNWFAVFGRTAEEPTRTGVFLVFKDPGGHHPGIEIRETWNHLGMRATGSHEVIFKDVIVTDEHAVDLRVPADWKKQADPHRISCIVVLIATIYDQIARNALDWLTQFLHDRVPSNLGAALSTLPRVQEKVGEIAALLYVNHALLGMLTSSSDQGVPVAEADAYLAKYQITNNAVRVLEIAMKLAGNHGLTRDNPLERMYRDVLCGRVHTPQDDMALIKAGLSVLDPQH